MTDDLNLKFARASRALLLFVLPLPLVAVVLTSLVSGDILRLLKSVGLLGGFFFAAVLMRRGLMDELAFKAQRFSFKPPPPRKTFATILTALSTFATSYLLASYPLLDSLGFMLGSGVGCALLYGLDTKRTDLVSPNLTEQAAEALSQAEQQVQQIELANAQIVNPELTERLNRICHSARQVLGILLEKPDNVRKARRFLNTYLDSAQKVAQGYAKTHQKSASSELESNFRNVLVTIEDVFAEQHSKLLEDDVLDLDVQIEVLKTQLEKEGVS